MARITMLKPQQNTVSITEGFKNFIKDCELKNLSPATIRSYDCHWRKFDMWVDADDVYSINQALMDNYVLFLKTALANTTSINTNLRHVRAVINFFSAEYHIPVITIKSLKQQETTKETYTDAELYELLKKPNIKKCPFTDYRNWVMTNFLIATGTRIGSLVSIKIGDVDLLSGICAVQHTKNKRPQMLYIPDSLAAILKEYLKIRAGNGSDYLFCGTNGSYLNPCSASHALAKYNTDRGVEKTSVHLYRHSFARHFILSGGTLHALQKQLGHNTLTMSLKYCNLYDVDVHKGMEQFNLHSNLTQSSKRIKMR